MSQPDQNDAVDEVAATGIDRRGVICSVGLLALGVAALSACGSGTDVGVSTGTPTGGATGSAGAGSNVIKIADIPVGGGKILADVKIVVTQPKAGEFKAFSAVCTHQGCTVGRVSDGTINCGCHGSRFDLTTGQVVAGPATTALPAKTATVSGDAITVS